MSQLFSRSVLGIMLVVMSSKLAFAILPGTNTNLVGNPSFNNALFYWQTSGVGEAIWVPNFGVQSDSGYVIGAVALISQGSSNTSISQCGSIGGEGNYTFKFFSLAYCSQSARGEVLFFSDSNCANDLGVHLVMTNSSPGVWSEIMGVVAAPSNAMSWSVALSNESACPDVAFFDEIYFGEGIFTNSFE